MKLSNPKISIVMGSQSDWSTLKHTSTVLKELKISHEKKIVSAHRTPKGYMNMQNKLTTKVLR